MRITVTTDMDHEDIHEGHDLYPLDDDDTGTLRLLDADGRPHAIYPAGRWTSVHVEYDDEGDAYTPEQRIAHAEKELADARADQATLDNDNED